jgi:hypothetical protein
LFLHLVSAYCFCILFLHIVSASCFCIYYFIFCVAHYRSLLLSQHKLLFYYVSGLPPLEASHTGLRWEGTLPRPDNNSARLRVFSNNGVKRGCLKILVAGHCFFLLLFIILCDSSWIADYSFTKWMNNP